MKISGAEITGHQITFCVREHEGQPVQYLTIIPLGFIDYGDNRWRADYVVGEIRLVIVRSRVVLDDHMTVGSLVDLHNLLLGFQNGLVGSGTFGTVEGHLELSAEWRDSTQDVRFVGRIPSFEYSGIENEPCGFGKIFIESCRFSLP
jgi:hypothetical protein